MSNITPGEWIALNGGPYIVAQGEDGGYRVVAITANTFNEVTFAAGVGTIEDKANAKVLAASPALFTACKDALEWIWGEIGNDQESLANHGKEGHDSDTCIVCTLRDALKKATP
jgi:hypothetical protein